MKSRKQYWWTYLQGRNRDTDRENRLDTVGEGEGGTNWESRADIYVTYTHICYWHLYTTLCTQLSRPWSRDWACTVHVGDHTPITWLIMHCSRGWSCNDHAATMYWSHDWSCTGHIIDHALFTWLIMHWSCDWSCADHVWCHTLIMCLWRQWT